jgi:hypothetical protein
MGKLSSCLASVGIAFGMWASSSFGQTGGVMFFDGGGDGTSWNQATNWNVTLNPDGTPTSGDPATPPTGQYTANIPLLGVVLDATMPGQTAFRVRTGVTTEGSFNVTGGSLEVTDDISVGHSAKGTMTMSGGAVTLGDDFFIDEQGDFGSTFTLNGGELHVIDRIVMGNHGNFVVNGGHIVADDDFFFFGNSTQTINGGLLEQFDKLSNGPATPMGPARLKINGGIVRANEWTDNSELGADDLTRFMSIIEVNSSGKLQIEADHFSVALAQNLIADGHLTTTGATPLGAKSIVIPEFFGRTNVAFTEVSVVPEPASLLLLALSGVALGLKRRS